MKCKTCGKNHHTDYHLTNKLTDKGFPTHEKNYKTAHAKANYAEKQNFGDKNFKRLGKIERSIKKHELLGKNTKSGKIEVSKKVPTKYREEVAYHEKIENKNLKKEKRKKI